VKEQSHKDEMSAALRGDFARLRDRGVAVTLAPPAADSTAAAPGTLPVAPAPPEPDPAADEPPPPAPEARIEPDSEPSEAPPADGPPPSVVVGTAAPEPDVERARAGGWLDRLLGR
jgi:hypothetical protein